MNGKVLLIGFDEREAQRVRNTLRVPVFEVPSQCRNMPVADIVETIENIEGPSNWHERKFVIMHGLDNETLKTVIHSIKSLNFGRIIFATTTETSLTWKLDDLLRELVAEDEYFRAMKWAKKETQKGKGLFLDPGKG